MARTRERLASGDSCASVCTVLGNSATRLRSTRVTKQVNRALSPAHALIGRHPLPILMLPSIWFFIFYLPFWKSSDVLCQLGDPFTSGNILLVPPIYCILGRIPFWLTDTLLLGSSPRHLLFSASIASCGARLDCLSTCRFVDRISIFCGGCSRIGNWPWRDHHPSRFHRKLLFVCSHRRS